MVYRRRRSSCVEKRRPFGWYTTGFVCATRCTKPCDPHASTSEGAPSFSYEGMVLMSNRIDSAGKRVWETFRFQSIHTVRFTQRLVFVILSFYSACVPTVIKRCISKDCRKCIVSQKFTRCSEKAWLSPGTSAWIICDPISGPGTTISFGYHRLATVPHYNAAL